MSANAEAPRRAAVAMLSALGGSEIILRVSAPMGDVYTRGLGLQQYDTSDVRLSPAILRPMKSGADRRWEVLLPATEVEDKLGPDVQVIAEALRAGAPMLFGDRLFHIVEFTCLQFAGREYLYRITLGE